MKFDGPDDFAEGDKVWFLGLKAEVVEDIYGVRKSHPFWAVPIEIKGEFVVTIAHSNHLKPRGKKK